MHSLSSSHKSHIARAQKNHVQIKQIYDQTVQSIDKLKNENFHDQLYLLREGNMYANDLNKVVFNLAQVTFKIDKAKQAHRDLQQTIDILCDLASATHKSFHHHHYEKIKTEFKNNIKAATHVAERLLSVICLNDIHEHKQEILNNQADVLMAVNQVYLTNTMKYLNPQQLEYAIQNELDTIKTILLSFDSKDPNIEQIIIQCANHSLQNSRSCVDHLTKAVTINHFSDEIKNLFVELIKAMNDYNMDMQQILMRNSQLDQLVENLHKSMAKGVGSIVKLVPLLAKENEEVTDNGMELVVYAYSKGIATVIQLRRSLENAKSDN